MPQALSPLACVDLFKPEMTIAVMGVTGEPTGILDILSQNPDAARDVHFISCQVPGVNDFEFTGLHPSTRMTGFFVYGNLASAYAEGRMAYLPLHYSEIYRYLAQAPTFDLAVVMVSPPDNEGRCSLGICVDAFPAIAGNTKTLLAQINPNMPVVPGAPAIRFSSIDYHVEIATPLPAFHTGDVSGTIRQIGANVANLIQDGDTFQIGIGKVPAAILTQLEQKNDLGLQGGMITDEAVGLIERGVLTGKRKSNHTGQTVAAMAFGTSRVYDHVAANSDILLKPTSYTHHVPAIASEANFVSINSVLEVDLFGQGNAETIRGRQVSGTGGLADFVRGARLSPGGRSILAFPATLAGGKKSRIVPELGAGQLTGSVRADTDYVVTEFGAARLCYKTEDQKAEALIEIAAPQHRSDLTAAWRDLQNRRQK